MSNFSAGKWTHNNTTGVISSDAGTVCNVHGATKYNVEPNAEECETNARLIVAAPEMYRILKDIQAWCEDSDLECDIWEVLNCIDGEEARA